MPLELKGVSVSYGKVAALRDLGMSVAPGSIVTVIGANGAGKSTALRAISGLEPLRAGEILFEGGRISGLPPDVIVSRGIAHVPEGRRVFPDLTVEENLRTGAFLRKDADAVALDLRSVFERFPRNLAPNHSS